MNNIIGITGRIGTGKSTTAKIISGMLGYEYISVDQIISKLYHNPMVRQILNNEFGVCSKDEMIKIFHTPEDAKRLSDVFHPILIGYFAGSILRSTCYVIEMPLLFEYGYECLFDFIVNVEVSNDGERHTRLIERDTTKLDTIKVMETVQMSDVDRNRMASLVIKNDGTLSELEDTIYILEDRLRG